jgi:hypothetical protein
MCLLSGMSEVSPSEVVGVVVVQEKILIAGTSRCRLFQHLLWERGQASQNLRHGNGLVRGGQLPSDAAAFQPPLVTWGFHTLRQC